MAGKAKILIASGIREEAHRIQAFLLALGYEPVLATDGEETLAKAREARPSLILLDILLPGMGGVAAAQKLREHATTRFKPIVMMTDRDAAEDRARALTAGADDFIIRPVDETELRARVNSMLKVGAYDENLRLKEEKVEAEVNLRTQALAKGLEKLKAASLDTVYRLCRAAEYKDEDTGAHVQRMSHYSSALARALGAEDDFVESVLWAAPMHDIGKIGIPDRILQKPGKLDADEWVIMRSHTTIGAEILKDADADFIRMAADIAISHHEKWDGTGYPRGIKSEEIPVAGRIVAMADVFDALTQDRVYRKAMPLDQAMEIIRQGKGTHFDPSVVDAFFSIEEELKKELGWWKFISSDLTSEETDLSDLFT